MPHTRLVPQVVRVTAILLKRAIVEIEHCPADIACRCRLRNDPSDGVGELTVHSFFANTTVEVYARVAVFFDMDFFALVSASLNLKILIWAEGLNELQLVPQLLKVCELVIDHEMLLV